MPEVNGENPFIVGEPVQNVSQFWGRAKQARFILEYVKSSQCVSLVAPLGYGKTSLLNYVSDPGVCARHGLRPEDALFVRVQGRELGECDQAACLRHFVERIIAQTEIVSPALAGELQDAVKGRSLGHLGLRALFRILCDDGRQPIVLLDDFDSLAHNAKLKDSFFAALRSLATGCKVSYVVVSQQPLYELETMRPEASTLCGICRQIKLPLLAEQESRALLLGSLEQAQVTWPAPIVELVLNKGRNEPWRLQLAGHEVFQVWQENGGGLREPAAAALEGRIDRAVACWAAR